MGEETTIWVVEEILRNEKRMLSEIAERISGDEKSMALLVDSINTGEKRLEVLKRER